MQINLFLINLKNKKWRVYFSSVSVFRIYGRGLKDPLISSYCVEQSRASSLSWVTRISAFCSSFVKLISISWIRRTRSGGDNWELPEVPLGEDAETYEVDVLDGTNVTRTLSVSSPVALYSRADQIADFGSVQSAVSIKVYQINTLFGRGAPRAALV